VRRLTLALLTAAGVACVAAPVAAQTPDPAPPTTSAAGGSGLVPVPAGCPQPQRAHVVFVGRLADRDTRTGRYEVQVVRAGSTEGFAKGKLIDVRYGIDAKFLNVGSQYLVGAGTDEGLLYSKVRPEEPMFGGDEVVGAAEIDVECPTVEDPVRTLTVTGRSIDSGVFQPLSSERGDLLKAIAVPVAVALAILIGLATLRWVLTGVAKGATSAASLSRTRRYQSGEP
jgi:hypothetical protein